MTIAHFSQFNDAATEFLAANKRYATSKETFGPMERRWWRQARQAALTIKHGQRFYFPDGVNVLKQLDGPDPARNDMLRLPCSNIAVLSESKFFHADGEMVQGWRISVASDHNSLDPLNIDLAKLLDDPNQYYWFTVTSAVRGPIGPWGILPVAMLVMVPLAGGGELKLALMEPPEEVQEHMRSLVPHTFDWLRELADDVRAVLSLCTMLNMHNVKHREVAPPEEVQARRAIEGKKPLFSYHVLNVGGGFGMLLKPVLKGLRVCARGCVKGVFGRHKMVRILAMAAIVHWVPRFVTKDSTLLDAKNSKQACTMLHGARPCIVVHGAFARTAPSV